MVRDTGFVRLGKEDVGGLDVAMRSTGSCGVDVLNTLRSCKSNG